MNYTIKKCLKYIIGTIETTGSNKRKYSWNLKSVEWSVLRRPAPKAVMRIVINDVKR